MAADRRWLAIAAVVLLGAGLVACGTTDSPAAPATTASAPAVTTTAGSPTSVASSAATTVLGPTGYGALVLGMTKAEARATGQVTGMDASDNGKCGGEGVLIGTPAEPDPDVTGMLFFSAASNTLVAIYAIPGVQTPEGIGLGSSYEQVHAAYPAWEGFDQPTSGRGLVAVPGNAQARYRIDIENNKIIELSLQSARQDCYE